MGYIYAFITSLFFTAYTLPKKVSRQSTTRYSAFQGIGFFGGSGIIYLIRCISDRSAAEPLIVPGLIWAVLSGMAWFFGCTCFFLSIDQMGLSRSNQWKNLQGPFGAVFNLLFLAEYRQTNVLFIILSCGFILLSAILLAIKSDNGGRISKKGVIYALLAAVLFGLNAMLLKHGTNLGFTYSQQFVLSGTVLICSLVFLGIREKQLIRPQEFSDRNNLLGILGGILYCAALTFSIMSYRILPGSVTFTIIQLNSVWTVLAGILIFHEIDFRKNRMRVIAGMVCAIIGVVMLLFA